MIYIRIHKTENGDMIGMCDSPLIDKVIVDGDLEINIRDYSDFYRGTLVSEKKAIEMIKPEKVYSASAIGKESVSAAIKGGIIHEDSVRHVDDVPYANSFRIKY